MSQSQSPSVFARLDAELAKISISEVKMKLDPKPADAKVLGPMSDYGRRLCCFAYVLLRKTRSLEQKIQHTAVDLRHMPNDAGLMQQYNSMATELEIARCESVAVSKLFDAQLISEYPIPDDFVGIGIKEGWEVIALSRQSIVRDLLGVIL